MTNPVNPAGRNPLLSCPALCAAAFMHAEDMVRRVLSSRAEEK